MPKSRTARQQELRRAADEKYREAVALYASTDLPARQICERTGVSPDGFRIHIQRYHRDLLLRRHDIRVSRQEADRLRLRRGGTGQTLPGHRKYREAIAACGDEEHIAYSVSQIARKFHLNATALGTQLRTHYPEIIRLREQERMRRGLNDNLPRGARPWCVEQYAEAVELLRTTDRTIRQAAEACNVSVSGLRVHVTQYHKDVVALRADRRQAARNCKTPGRLNGSGVVTQPQQGKLEEFREAVELYRTTSLTIGQIARQTGVSRSGLSHHIYRWHRGLVLERKGLPAPGEDEYADLSRTKRRLKATRLKYAEAIERLRAGAGSMAGVAAEFGFNPDTFRGYVQKHEPELFKRYGQQRRDDGRGILTRSSEKYAEAIRLYRTTPEPLKAIAEQLGLVYKSLFSFIRRNHPDAIGEHNAVGEAAG